MGYKMDILTSRQIDRNRSAQALAESMAWMDPKPAAPQDPMRGISSVMAPQISGSTVSAPQVRGSFDINPTIISWRELNSQKFNAPQFENVADVAYNPWQAQGISGIRDVQANPYQWQGISSIANVNAERIDPTANQFNMAGIPAIGWGQVAQQQAGQSGLGEDLMRRAREQVALGGQLSSEDMRSADQTARSAFADRGMGRSNSAIFAEAMNRDVYSRQRQNERQTFATGVEQLDQQRRMSDAALRQQTGLANAQGQFAADEAGLGAWMQGSLANQQTGLQAQLANQDAGLRAALANQQMGYNVGAFNAGAENQAGQFNSDLGLQAGMANQQMQYNVGAFNAGAQNQAASEASQYGLQAALANQQSGLTRAQTMYQGQLSTNQANQNAWLQSALGNQQTYLQARMANQRTGSQIALANQDAGLRGLLANQENSLRTNLANQDAGLRAMLANQGTQLGVYQTDVGAATSRSVANIGAGAQMYTTNANNAQDRWDFNANAQANRDNDARLMALIAQANQPQQPTSFTAPAKPQPPVTVSGPTANKRR